MTRRQKIAVLAVLAGLALLYAGAIGTGAGAGTGNQNDLHNGFVRWLGARMGQPAAVARQDLSADCLTDSTLTVHDTCTVHVASGGPDPRRLRLHARDAVTVTAKAPRTDTVAHDDVGAGADANVTLDSTAGDVTIACAGASTCTVTLP